MRPFLRLIAFLITLIAVLLLPVVLFGFQIGQIVFSQEAMLGLVAGETAGPAPADTISQALLQSLPEAWGIDADSTLGQALSTFTEQSAIPTAFLPIDLKREYAAQTLKSFYAWLDGPEPLPVLRLDMLPLKTQLQQSAADLVNDILEKLPLCTAEESLGLLSTVFAAIMRGEAVLQTIPSCLPAIIPVETVAPAASKLLQAQIGLIPDQVILENVVRATPERMQEIKNSLRLTRSALQWSWLPILFLLLIAALAGGQTRDGVPRWLGWSLVASAALTFLITLVPSSWWAAAIIPQLTGWPLILRLPAITLAPAIFATAAQATLWLAVALLITGLLLLFLSFFLRQSPSKVLI